MELKVYSQLKPLVDGGGHLMVWAIINTDGSTDMDIVRCGMNVDRYINDILCPHFVPYADNGQWMTMQCPTGLV